MQDFEEWPGQLDGQALSLGYFHPFAEGDYVLTLEILSGAPALQGVDQKLVSKYQPCGLELMPAMLMKITGVILLALSGVTLFGVITTFFSSSDGAKAA